MTATAAEQQKSESSYRMCGGVIHLPNHGYRRKQVITYSTGLVTEAGVAMQKMLEFIKQHLQIELDDDKKVKSARLTVEVSGKNIPRAERLYRQPITKFGYANAYRLVSFKQTDENRAVIEFEIAAAKRSPTPEERLMQKVLDDVHTSFQELKQNNLSRNALMEILRRDLIMPADSPLLALKIGNEFLSNLTKALDSYPEDEKLDNEFYKKLQPDWRQLPSTGKRTFDCIPANFFAQVLAWIPFAELRGLTDSVQGGIRQKAAEQVLSFLTLVDEDPNTSFPSIDERSPEVKKGQWLAALERISQNMTGFEYKRAIDIDPSLPEEDPKSHRRINVDSDWITFVDTPEVNRFPVVFSANDVVVYRRYTTEELAERGIKHYSSNEGRLYALVPVEQPPEKALLWWTQHKNEFTPLAAFGPRKWPKNDCALMVPLEYRDNLDILEEETRRVKWTVLTEEKDTRPFRRGHEGNTIPFHSKRWILKFATETSIVLKDTTATLGVHLHNEDEKQTVMWSLAKDGAIVERGEFEQTSVLDFALVKKDYLEKMQRAHRWVGRHQFKKELKRRTEELAHKIVRLAVRKNATLQIEEISYVQKSGQSASLNSRNSLWNYAELENKTQFFALDRHGLPTLVVPEYRNKFQCPSCGAIRKAKETEENATTWRKDGILSCRKCGKQTAQTATYFADQSALYVWKKNKSKEV